MAFFGFGEIAEQTAHSDILRLFGRLHVEALGLHFHRLDLPPDGVERQVLGQPDRAATQEALDVLAANGRQVRSETLLVHFQQHVAMSALFLGHLLENLGGIRITLLQILGEAHIDTAVLLLGGNRDRKHLAFGQIGKVLH